MLVTLNFCIMCTVHYFKISMPQSLTSLTIHCCYSNININVHRMQIADTFRMFISTTVGNFFFKNSDHSAPIFHVFLQMAILDGV